MAYALLLLICGIYFLTGFFTKKYPPKKINGSYGYRTKRSMKNLRNWVEAQEFSSDEMMKTSFASSLLYVPCQLFLDPNEWLLLMLFLGLTFIIPIYVYYETEKHLKEFEE